VDFEKAELSQSLAWHEHARSRANILFTISLYLLGRGFATRLDFFDPMIPLIVPNSIKTVVISYSETDDGQSRVDAVDIV